MDISIPEKEQKGWILAWMNVACTAAAVGRVRVLSVCLFVSNSSFLAQMAKCLRFSPQIWTNQARVVAR
jgi:hypothetical protein